MFSSRLYSFVLDNYTHTFSFIMSTVKGNMMRIIRAVYFVLVLITFVFVSIDVYFYSFFFSPLVTFGQPAHICALQTSHKVAALQFESPEDQLVRDEKKGIARNRGHFAPVINCQRNLISKWRTLKRS